MKTTVFNLIIMDESGSMGNMRSQTISGCNETLNMIRTKAAEHAETMNNLVSIYAFQQGGPVPSRYLIKNTRPEDVKDVTDQDYKPCGGTPLLDAVGSTLTELKMIAATHEDATAVVTIMTDGYENASVEYDWQTVAKLISEVRELGWTVNLIGADIDVEQMARRMNIHKENAISYHKSDSETKEMWDTLKASMSLNMEAELEMDRSLSPNERAEIRKKRSTGFFKR